MGREVDIPWVGGSKYHGEGGQYSMGRGRSNTIQIKILGVNISYEMLTKIFYF